MYWELKKNQFPFKHIFFSARVFGATGIGIATPAVHAVSKGAEPRNPQLCKLVNRTLIYFQIRRPTPISEIAHTRVDAVRPRVTMRRRVRAHACVYVRRVNMTDHRHHRQSRTRYTPCSAHATNVFRRVSRVSWDSSHLVTTILFTIETLLVFPFIPPNECLHKYMTATTNKILLIY